jgi:phosphate/sulfate permease
VGSKTLKLWSAVLIAGIFEFLVSSAAAAAQLASWH